MVYQPTDATLFKTISQGRSGTVMAGFADQLSADDIWTVIAFIRSRYRGDPAKIVWRGAEAARGTCAGAGSDRHRRGEIVTSNGTARVPAPQSGQSAQP